MAEMDQLCSENEFQIGLTTYFYSCYLIGDIKGSLRSQKLFFFCSKYFYNVTLRLYIWFLIFASFPHDIIIGVLKCIFIIIL